MSLHPRRLLAALSFVLALGSPARAAHGISDEAHLIFSADACARASRRIETIHNRTGKDLYIETLGELSPEDLKQYRSRTNERDRARFFRELAERNAAGRDVKGVYVLLCRVPPSREPHTGLFGPLKELRDRHTPQAVGRAAIVWPASEEPVFSEQDLAELGRILGEIRVVGHNEDAALDRAVAFVGDRLEQHARELSAPPLDNLRWTSVLLAAGVLAAAWGFISLARARVAARQGTPGPVPGAAEPLAVQYGTAGVLWLAQAYLARRREPPPPAPAPEVAPDGEGGMHPDDRAAIERGPGPWDHADAEAGAGHDLT
ncbi:MAG TPA: hypothetical protein VFW33_04805 [Gemmataceae bacterium]|nr:hypothetical protein [Gemmataceae bacterium]